MRPTLGEWLLAQSLKLGYCPRRTGLEFCESLKKQIKRAQKELRKKTSSLKTGEQGNEQ